MPGRQCSRCHLTSQTPTSWCVAFFKPCFLTVHLCCAAPCTQALSSEGDELEAKEDSVYRGQDGLLGADDEFLRADDAVVRQPARRTVGTLDKLTTQANVRWESSCAGCVMAPEDSRRALSPLPLPYTGIWRLRQRRPVVEEDV